MTTPTTTATSTTRETLVQLHHVDAQISYLYLLNSQYLTDADIDQMCYTDAYLGMGEQAAYDELLADWECRLGIDKAEHIELNLAIGYLKLKTDQYWAQLFPPMVDMSF